MGMNGLIDILFLGCGIYLIYTACMAKKNGTIATNVMLDKNTNEKSIKDKNGYIEYMYKKIIAAGALIVVSGVVNLINDYYISSMALNWIGILLILAAIVVYIVAYKNGRRIYIEMRKKEEHKK
ncbi:MAG: hypothetical protein J6A08_13425 [Lachnospiraceae bacterium]|nr:hypothetical protein [Lachnospiraceae bacterium]